MNELTRFYNDHPVRIVDRDGEQWFVAKDVCEILELGNTSQAVSYLDDDEKGISTNDTPSGRQEMLIVSESGLYSLIFRSRKDEAKNFRRWVTHEVLPSIRKNGMYVQDSFKDYVLDLLKINASQARLLSEKDEKIRWLMEFAPKSDYGDPNRYGNPRYQKRRGYYVANRGADVARRDPDKYGYQTDLFYDRLPQVLAETFIQTMNRLAEGD
jgi:prophage antirepressor-like protein